jgi:hypothetical protein
VSLGRDVNYNNPQVPEDMGWIVKVWDFNNFVQDGYIPAGPLGLTGGYLRAGAIGAQMNQMQDLHS